MKVAKTGRSKTQTPPNDTEVISLHYRRGTMVISLILADLLLLWPLHSLTPVQKPSTQLYKPLLEIGSQTSSQANTRYAHPKHLIQNRQSPDTKISGSAADVRDLL